jgi:hypothetical protein
VQSGENLQASGVTLRSNEIWSSGPSFVDPTLQYSGNHNRYQVVGNDPAYEQKGKAAFLALHETDSTLTAGKHDLPRTNAAGWRLELNVPSGILRRETDADLRGALVELRSAALQFGHCGLKVLIRAPESTPLAEDWAMPSDGILFDKSNDVAGFSLRLISPQGEAVRTWNAYPSPADLGLALRENIGPPNYSYLSFEEVRAKD